jgi:LysM repeat protein
VCAPSTPTLTSFLPRGNPLAERGRRASPVIASLTTNDCHLLDAPAPRYCCAMRRGLLIVPLLALALAGCTSVTPQLVASETPKSAPTVSAAPSSPAASTSPDPGVPYPLAPEPPAYVTVVPDQYISSPGTNEFFRVEVPSADTGSTKYATGTAILEGSKVVAYKVASGDILDFIVKRFGLSNDGYIVAVNAVRRGNSAILYAGDVLNLSAYTLHKYGSINGKVMSDPDPSPMPPQEP